jgi:hypothetical protein
MYKFTKSLFITAWTPAEFPIIKIFPSKHYMPLGNLSTQCLKLYTPGHVDAFHRLLLVSVEAH